MKTIDIPHVVVETIILVTCPECKGSGTMPLPWKPELSYKCTQCKGVGKLTPEEAREVRMQDEDYRREMGDGGINEENQ